MEKKRIKQWMVLLLLLLRRRRRRRAALSYLQVKV
jgi:hypothetical protein